MSEVPLYTLGDGAANPAQLRQPRLDSGFSFRHFQVKVLKSFQVVPSFLGSRVEGLRVRVYETREKRGSGLGYTRKEGCREDRRVQG